MGTDPPNDTPTLWAAFPVGLGCLSPTPQPQLGRGAHKCGYGGNRGNQVQRLDKGVSASIPHGWRESPARGPGSSLTRMVNRPEKSQASEGGKEESAPFLALSLGGG